MILSGTAGGTLNAGAFQSTDSSHYTVLVSGMTTSGSVIATIAAGAVQGQLGGQKAASTSTDNTVTWNAPPPLTVAINQASSQADPTSTSPIDFRVVFSQPVFGFTGADVSFGGSTAGGTLAAAVVSGSDGDADYTVAASGMTTSGSVIASIPASAAENSNNQQSTASTSTDHTVTWNEPPPPSVTVNQASSQDDPTAVSPIVSDVEFSQPVDGFAASTISFAGSTAGGNLLPDISGSGKSYTLSVTGMTTAGTVVASMLAGGAQNATGEGNTASTSTDNSVTWDSSAPPAPSVTINQGSGQADPTSTSPVTFSVAFSEPVTGFTASDVVFTGSTAGGTLKAGLTGSGASYTVTVTGMTTSGTVVASNPAGAASDESVASTASTSTDNSVTWHQPLPAPTVTINQAAAQADPTTGSSISFAVVFSENVIGFSDNDVDLSSSTAGGSLAAAVTGSGATYTVKVSGMTTSGTVVATVRANAAINGSSEPSAASTSTDNVVTWNPPPPAPNVTINQASGQADPTSTSPVSFSVLFSEPVTGFTASDIAFAGSRAGGTLKATVTGAGVRYTVKVSGMTTSGTVVASIPAGAAADQSVPSTASISTDNSVTWKKPAAVKRPNTRITRSTITSRTAKATFIFVATGKATRFQCALAKGHAKLHFTTCRSPKSFKHLAKGRYTFEVRAVGPGGTDKTPALAKFTIKR